MRDLRFELLCLTILAACGGPRKVERIAGVMAIGAAQTRLVVTLEHGSVTILPDDSEDQVRFEGETLRVAPDAKGLAALEALDVRLRPQADAPPDSLHLSVPKVPVGLDPETHRVVVRVALHVPRRLGVSVRTGVGHVKVVEMAGGCDAETQLGDVAFQRCGGLARARTVHGNVLVDAHQGDVDVESPGGMVQVFVARLGAQGVRALARDASIVHLPQGAGFQLDAASSRAACANGFGVPVGREGDGQRARGLANGGGPRVLVRSEFGRVSIAAGD